MRSRFVCACLLGAAIACNSSPAAPSAALTSFQYSGGLSLGSPAAPSVHVSPGRIQITAETTTPTPCYMLAGDVATGDHEVTLRVVARATGAGVCVQAIGRFSYDAVIALPAGTYALVVVHSYPNTGWPVTEILRQTVTVG